jgi:hypothetical protein
MRLAVVDHPNLCDFAELPGRYAEPVARYHFNIRNGCGFTADEEGLELSSDKAARAQAIRGARSLMSAEMLEGMLDLDGQIEVTDDWNDEVMTVRFRDAVHVHQGNLPTAANQ